MNDEEFKHRKAHLSSQNVMTADNPPEWDVQALEEQYIEQRTTELMEGLYDSPDRIQEYIMEGDYENTNLKLVFQIMADNLILPSKLSKIALLQTIKTYLEDQVTKEAEEYVEGL